MAEKILNTRIQLKYDRYENWYNNNPVLKQGEAAIAYLPKEDDDSNAAGLAHAPSIVVKIGDGEHHYRDLEFISGLAADVHAWAKAAEKPEYKASEITGLSEFIHDDIKDTDTQYQLVKVNNNEYKLQSKALNGAWGDVECDHIIIPEYDDTEVKASVKTVSDAVAAIKEDATIVTFKGIEDKLADYALNSAVTAVAGRVTTLESEMDTAQGNIETQGQDIATMKDQLTGIGADSGSVKKYVDDAKTAVSGEVSALAGKVGEVPADKTVVGLIEEAKQVASNANNAMDERMDAVEGEVDTLVGDDSGKSVRAIANEELAAQLIPANADEARDTLQEIAAWIQSHPGDASAMNKAIQDLQKQLSGIDAGDGTVKKYVDDAIDALKIGDYALAADLTALASRVTTLEGEMTAAQGAIEQAQADIEANEQAISDLDGSLAAIAKSGNVNDLVQTAGDVLVFDCGTSAV